MENKLIVYKLIELFGEAESFSRREATESTFTRGIAGRVSREIHKIEKDGSVNSERA